MSTNYFLSAGALAHELNGVLTVQLAGIQDKRFLDDRWFDFDAQGHLMLVDRPLDCLSQIWECIVRLFTNKLADLEHEFTIITERVEQYLEAEGDTVRRDEFLLRFTPALNELYRCAGRMQAAQRISEQALAQMQAKPFIQDIVIVPRPADGMVGHNGVMHPKYHAKGHIGLANMTESRVIFQFNNPAGYTWQTSDKFRRELPAGHSTLYPVHSAFEDLQDVNEVTATVSYPFTVKPGNSIVHIDPQGKPIAMSVSLPKEEADFIVVLNSSCYTARCSAIQDGRVVAAYEFVPGVDHPSFKLPKLEAGQDSCQIEISVVMTTPKRLALNFKNGFYECIVGQNGLAVSSKLDHELSKQHAEKQAAASAKGSKS